MSIYVKDQPDTEADYFEQFRGDSFLDIEIMPRAEAYMRVGDQYYKSRMPIYESNPIWIPINVWDCPPNVQEALKH